MKSFKYAVSEGHAPVDVELAGVSVAMDANAGCNVYGKLRVEIT